MRWFPNTPFLPTTDLRFGAFPNLNPAFLRYVQLGTLSKPWIPLIWSGLPRIFINSTQNPYILHFTWNDHKKYFQIIRSEFDYIIFWGSKIHYCWLDSHMFSATQMSRSPFGRFHPVIDAENLAQQILTRQISQREGVGWSGCEILTIDRYAFHDDDGHASQMFYRGRLISVFSGPALQVVSELGGQARLPCSLSSPKVPQ